MVVSVRFSAEEAADLDVRKGTLSRSEWLRLLNAQARRKGWRFGRMPRD